MKIYLFLPLVAYSLALPTYAQQATPKLSLQQALERGLSRSDLQDILQGRIDLAESKVLELQTWDNPEMLLSTESTEPAGVDTKEHYLLFSQRIEMPKTRRLQTQAARHLANATNLRNQSELLTTKAHIKDVFYKVLYQQTRVSVMDHWHMEVQRVRNIVAKREEAGQVSGYDRRRLSREIAEAQALRAEQQASYLANWERLKTFLQLDEDYQLIGQLLPPSQTLVPELTAHPDLLAYEEDIQAASLQAMAANKWRFSEMTVEAGLKKTSIADQDDNGLFLSARLPLPFLNRNKSHLMKAKAQSMVAAGEKALAQSKAQGHIRALNTKISQTRTAAEHYRLHALEESKDLVKIALLSYQEGEIEILSLLDAYTSVRDAELKSLDFEFEIRKLTTELERIGGVK